VDKHLSLIAWRTIGKNPCDNPPVKIIIGPVEKGTQVYPWILPLEKAVKMFGQEVVDQIGEDPIPISLELLSPRIDRVARKPDH